MASSTRFQKLMEPGYIGSLRIKNRLIKTGSSPGIFGFTDGYVHPGFKDYYEALARGGAGLVVVSRPNMTAPGPQIPIKGYSLHDDKYIPELTELSGAIRKYDCPVLIQLFLTGPMGGRPRSPGTEAVGASSLSKSELPLPEFVPTREMSIAEIEEVVQLFVNLAVRAKKAGFQGLELNGGCNHLFNSFLSRAWNKRQDDYGIGSLEGRAKIMVDIIKEIKIQNGKDFALIALINGAEPGLKNGLTSEETQGIARILQAAGADAIHVRAELYTNPKDPDMRNSTHFPDVGFYPEAPPNLGEDVDVSQHGTGGWVPLAAAIKKVVSIPVITVGRMGPEIGERVLRRGMADYISMNRRLMADHDLPNKVDEGRLEDIAPCTGCLTCFSITKITDCPPMCRVNAAFGKEKEYEIKPAEKKKRVMVVGGGPAGMETARVAAMRGHKVMLYEKERKLGGSMLLAAMVKGFDKEDILGLVRYLETQVTKLGVDIRSGHEVSRSVVEEIKPDVLVIATGGVHNVPDLPGVNGRNVVTSRDLHRKLKSYMRLLGPKALRWLTKFWMPIGQRVVIIGGNVQGCQVAELLVKRGRKITIVESGEEIGEGLVIALIKPFLLAWLADKGVTMLTRVKYEEITEKGLTITDNEEKRRTIEADTIVTALPLLSNAELIKSLEGAVPEVYTIGDCAKPGLIIDAIAEGSRVGRAI